MTDLSKLRAQIAAGTYRVDADSIASAMLDYANAGEVSPPPGADPASASAALPLGRRQPEEDA